MTSGFDDIINFNNDSNHEIKGLNILTRTEIIDTSSANILEIHSHNLKMIHDYFICNICDQTLNANSYFCEICQFFMCGNCAEKINKGTPDETRNKHIHTLQPKTRLNNWSCDGCSSNYKKNRVSWRCTPCDFDLCVKCNYIFPK